MSPMEKETDAAIQINDKCIKVITATKEKVIDKEAIESISEVRKNKYNVASNMPISCVQICTCLLMLRFESNNREVIFKYNFVSNITSSTSAACFCSKWME